MNQRTLLLAGACSGLGAYGCGAANSRTGPLEADNDDDEVEEEELEPTTPARSRKACTMQRCPAGCLLLAMENGASEQRVS